MTIFDSVRLVIYRCHEKGLEVLLIKPDLKEDKSIWRLPKARFDISDLQGIELDETTAIDGTKIKNIAIEADWHEIPSVRGIIKHDIKRLQTKVKKLTKPTPEQCNYLVVKDALKEVLPQEYQALKELKDIIVDKNLSTSI